MKRGLVLLLVTLAAASYEVTEEDICCLPKKVGPCRAAIRRWYFNVKTGACERFTYGGCQGNKNNFKNKCECQICCGDNKDICCQPKKVGRCYAALERWFYNSTSDACELFLYGGCHGNQNNFEEKCQCEKQCL